MWIVLRWDYEKNPRFTAEFTADYMAVKPDLTIAFHRLMQYVQESSLMHTDSTSYPMAWFVENHKGWILTNWQIEEYKSVRFGERLVISTWPANFRGITAERVFLVENGAGERILAANSLWMYADIISKKPERPFQEMLEGYGPIGETVMEKNFNMPEQKGYQFVSAREYTVTRRDLDSNYHVNNVKYIEWVSDDIPDSVYYASFPKSMKVAYKKECVLGDKLSIEMYQGAENQFFSMIRKAGENKPAAEIYSRW